MMSSPGAAIERRPEGLLNRFAAAGGPQHLLAARAAGLALHQRDEPLGGERFDFGDGVVGVERDGFAEFAGLL